MISHVEDQTNNLLLHSHTRSTSHFLPLAREREMFGYVQCLVVLYDIIINVHVKRLVVLNVWTRKMFANAKFLVILNVLSCEMFGYVKRFVYEYT